MRIPAPRRSARGPNAAGAACRGSTRPPPGPCTRDREPATPRRRRSAAVCARAGAAVSASVASSTTNSKVRPAADAGGARTRRVQDHSAGRQRSMESRRSHIGDIVRARVACLTPNDRTTTISLAYSVDADDAFMFHALRAGAIDTGPLALHAHARAHRGAEPAGDRRGRGRRGGLGRRLSRDRGALPDAAARRLGRPRFRSGGGRAAAARARRSHRPARRDSGSDHHRVDGAAADRARRHRCRDPDLAVRGDLRRARRAGRWTRRC